MSLDFIQSKIPHRPPMLLLDRVLEMDEQSICCEKTFRDDDFFVQGHYPGNPIVPGFILCEAAAQAGAVLAASRQAFDGTPLLARVNDVKFKQVVRPGDQIKIQASLDQQLSSALYFSARVLLHDRLAVSLNFTVMVATSE